MNKTLRVYLMLVIALALFLPACGRPASTAAAVIPARRSGGLVRKSLTSEAVGG